MPRFTEAKWLRDGSLELLLAFVRIQCRPDRRKQGLLLCELCRLSGSHLPEGTRRKAVELGERLAEGRAFEPLRSELDRLLHDWPAGDHRAEVAWAHLIRMCLTKNPVYAYPFQGIVAAADAAVRRLLHDLFGNPFRPVKVDRTWLTRNDGLVGKMAHIIRQEARFEDLPILADALEDAGCTEPEILAHCRAAGLHFPGCWVLDRLRFAGQ
jgi:hypothetical protein